MKVYIAGPMRGRKMLNFPAFIRAARILRKLGYKAECPAEWDLADGVNPNRKISAISKRKLKQFLLRDITRLLKCNAVFLLNGWRHSRGAKAEMNTALCVGIPVYEAEFRGEEIVSLYRIT